MQHPPPPPADRRHCEHDLRSENKVWVYHVSEEAKEDFAAERGAIFGRLSHGIAGSGA